MVRKRLVSYLIVSVVLDKEASDMLMGSASEEQFPYQCETSCGQCCKIMCMRSMQLKHETGLELFEVRKYI